MVCIKCWFVVVLSPSLVQSFYGLEAELSQFGMLVANYMVGWRLEHLCWVICWKCIWLWMGWRMQDKHLVLTAEDLAAALREVGLLEPLSPSWWCKTLMYYWGNCHFLHKTSVKLWTLLFQRDTAHGGCYISGLLCCPVPRSFFQVTLCHLSARQPCPVVTSFLDLSQQYLLVLGFWLLQYGVNIHQQEYFADSPIAGTAPSQKTGDWVYLPSMQCQGVLVEKQSILLALFYKRIWHDFHNQFYKTSSSSYPLFSFAVVIVKCSMVFTNKSPLLWKIRKFWNWELITRWVIATIISMAHACDHWVLMSA